MRTLYEYLAEHPVCYISRDFERANGLNSNAAGYHIIANSNDFEKGEKILDTNEMMCLTETKNKLKAWNCSNILVFKNTSAIELEAKKNNWNLLNPSSALSNKIEEKISQVEWLGDLENFLPPHKILLIKDINFTGRPFIIQFNHAHTGNGTILISSAAELQTLCEQFPNRPARVTDYIIGSVFTNNNIVSTNKIFTGNISYQITGLQPFTDRPFATIGNDWGYAHGHLADKHKTQFEKMATAIGEKLQRDGWRGLFGIDVILDEKTDKLYLIEINARQPASSTFESRLQSARSDAGRAENKRLNQITTFEAHLAALLNLDLNNAELIHIKSGAQIVLRMQTKLTEKNLSGIAKQIESLGLNVIQYRAEKNGADLLRIQSSTSLLNDQTKLNAMGIKIAEIIDTL